MNDQTKLQRLLDTEATVYKARVLAEKKLTAARNSRSKNELAIAYQAALDALDAAHAATRTQITKLLEGEL